MVSPFYQTLEAEIAGTYTKAHAFIAIHPYWSVLGAAVFGWLVAHI